MRLARAAPACYFGGRELSKDVSDKQCTKCALLVDRKGQLKAAPSNVPEKNPGTGQPTAFYGGVPAQAAKPADPTHSE